MVMKMGGSRHDLAFILRIVVSVRFGCLYQHHHEDFIVNLK